MILFSPPAQRKTDLVFAAWSKFCFFLRVLHVSSTGIAGFNCHRLCTAATNTPHTSKRSKPWSSSLNTTWKLLPLQRKCKKVDLVVLWMNEPFSTWQRRYEKRQGLFLLFKAFLQLSGWFFHNITIITFKKLDGLSPLFTAPILAATSSHINHRSYLHFSTTFLHSLPL